MNTASHYKLLHFIPWTRKHIYTMLILSIVPTALFYFMDWKWLAIPWVPVALLGTAIAFISGFRNTQTYKSETTMDLKKITNNTVKAAIEALQSNDKNT